jgi:hypothetical protein
MFEKFVSLIPPSLHQVSGAVFNSGRNAFSAQSPLYILGLNPGGSVEKHEQQTVQWHTEKVSKKPADWAEYQDESWDGKTAGRAGLQPRVLHLLKQLNLDPCKVPSSNLIFKRTKSEAELGRDFDVLAEQCWPFHESVIYQLNIRVILCFGKRAGSWVSQRLEANTFVSEFEELNDRKWKTQGFINPQGIHVVAATHPSRVNWANPRTDPTSVVRNILLQP